MCQSTSEPKLKLKNTPAPPTTQNKKQIRPESEWQSLWQKFLTHLMMDALLHIHAVPPSLRFLPYLFALGPNKISSSN